MADVMRMYIPNLIDERKSFVILICENCGEPINKTMKKCPDCSEELVFNFEIEIPVVN